MKVRCQETGIDQGLKQGAGDDAVFHTQVFPGVARRLRFGPVKGKERKPDLILFFSIPSLCSPGKAQKSAAHSP